jgi:hypothetical protein
MTGFERVATPGEGHSAAIPLGCYRDAWMGPRPSNGKRKRPVRTESHWPPVPDTKTPGLRDETGRFKKAVVFRPG